MIAVVDVGTGNLRSVVRALEAAADAAGVTTGGVHVSADPDLIARAARVVLPGQGAFGDCATAFGRGGGALADALRSTVAAGRPFLGICLGMQVLFDHSDEAPGCAGLGIFRGAVRRLEPAAAVEGQDPIKIPHVGWNRVEITDRGASSLGHDDWYYFVHSFHVVPEDPAIVAGRTSHGVDFVSAVAQDNVTAAQFHPEKSQRAGLALLERWLRGPA